MIAKVADYKSLVQEVKHLVHKNLASMEDAEQNNKSQLEDKVHKN